MQTSVRTRRHVPGSKGRLRKALLDCVVGFALVLAGLAGCRASVPLGEGKLYDVPPEKRELLPGLPKQGQLSHGSRQGRNDFDETGYGGPCPHWKSEHRYVFSLFALDSKLNLPPGATKAQVEGALKGHVLASGELIGRYQR